MKRFLALFITGTMLLSQNVCASEMPENYWASEYMYNGSSIWELCDTDEYDDNVTYGDGNDILGFYLSFNTGSDDYIFHSTDYTNSYITRREWARGVSGCIDLMYSDVLEDIKDCDPEEQAAIYNVPADMNVYAGRSASYSDIREDDPDKQAIDNCYKYCIMVGYNDNTFRPDEYITYAEAMTTLTMLMDMDKQEGILADKGINYDEYMSAVYSTGMDSFKALMDLAQKAKDGTLKSDKKLSSEMEEVLNVYLDAADKAAEAKNIQEKENMHLEGSITADGTEYSGSINLTADVKAVFDDEHMPKELYENIKYVISVPELKDVLDTAAEYYNITPEENGDYTVEYSIYLKDGYIYIDNPAGTKQKIAYSDGIISGTNVMPDISISAINEANRLMTEYIYRESMVDGSAKDNKDGSKDLNIKYDINAMFASLGIDLDKFVDSMEEGASLTIGDIDIDTHIDSDGFITDGSFKTTVSFDSDAAKGDIDVTADMSVEYDSSAEIDFPDFSDYEDMSSYYEDIYSDELDDADMIGGSDGPTSIVTF